MGRRHRAEDGGRAGWSEAPLGSYTAHAVRRLFSEIPEEPFFEGPASWVGLVLLAAAVRAAVLVAVPDALAADPDGYRRLAENLVVHGVFGHGVVPTAYRPPLYPMMLAPAVALSEGDRLAIGLLHLVLGVGTVVITRLLASRVVRARVALLAALFVAVDPVLLGQSARVMTEILAALLGAATLWALAEATQRPSGASGLVAGALVALGGLCRPVFFPFGLVVVLLLLWLVRHNAFGRRMVAGYLLGLMLVVLPWMARNERCFGRPIIGTTHGGYTLLLGNNPSFYAYLRQRKWGEVWDVEDWQRDRARSARLEERRRGLAGSDRVAAEVAADRAMVAEAWEHIRRNPGRFVHACLVRIGRLWSPLPHRVALGDNWWWEIVRWATAIWYLAMLPLALVGMATWVAHRGLQDRDQRAGRVLLWSVVWIAVTTLVHALFWSNMRMRAPLSVAVALFSAVGWVVVWRWLFVCKWLFFNGLGRMRSQ